MRRALRMTGLAALCCLFPIHVFANADPVSATIIKFDDVFPPGGGTVTRYDGAHTHEAVLTGGSGTYDVRWRAIMPFWADLFLMQTPPITDEAIGGTKAVNGTTDTTQTWTGTYVAETFVKIKASDVNDPLNRSQWDVVAVFVTDRDWVGYPAASEEPTLGSAPWGIAEPMIDHHVGEYDGWLKARAHTHKVNDNGPNTEVRFVEKLDGTRYKNQWELHHELISNPLGPFGLAQGGAPDGEISVAQLVAWTSRHEALGPTFNTSHHEQLKQVLTGSANHPSQWAEDCLSLTNAGTHYFSDGSSYPMGSGAFRAAVEAFMQTMWTQNTKATYDALTEPAAINAPVDANGVEIEELAESIDFWEYWPPVP